VTDTNRILALLEDGAMTRKEICLCTGLPPKKATAVLGNMHSKGLIQKLGDKRYAQWCLPGHEPSQVWDLVAQHEQTAASRYLMGRPL